MTISHLLDDLRESDIASDPWGVALSRLFDVAEELHFNRHLACPNHWEFQPGLGMSQDHDDLLRDFDDGALMHFGDLLHRIVKICEAKGLSY